MLKGKGTRFAGLLLAVLILLCCLPLPALASEYDPLYPEILHANDLSAASAILIEANTGNVIFEKNADAIMYPASTTKILTVWLAINMTKDNSNEAEGTGLYQKITVSENAVNLAADESSAKLAAGEEVRLIDLMYAAMLLSGNDAATAIAEGLSGSVEAFAYEMNRAAVALGCTGSHFVNANGLHDDNHYTTARDMAILAQVAMEDSLFRDIVGRTSYVMPKDNIYRSRTIENRNRFLTNSENNAKYYYQYSTGIKTGTTSAAGNCFIGSAVKDGVSLISVVLGAAQDGDRYTDTIKLMDYGFSQFQSITLTEIYARNPRVIDIRGFDLDDPEVGRLTLNLRKVDSRLSDLIVASQDQIDYWAQHLNTITVTNFTREFTAPITAGEVMGTMTFTPEDGGSTVTYELVAARSIAAREQLAPSIDQIIQAAMEDPNPFPRITFELVFRFLILPVLAVMILVWLIRRRHKRKTRHTRRRFKGFKPTIRYYQ